MDSKFNQMYFYLFNFSVLVTWSSTHLINHSHLSFNHQLLFIPTISLDHSFRPLQQQQPPNNSSCWTFTSRKVFFFFTSGLWTSNFPKNKNPYSSSTMHLIHCFSSLLQIHLLTLTHFSFQPFSSIPAEQHPSNPCSPNPSSLKKQVK